MQKIVLPVLPTQSSFSQEYINRSLTKGFSTELKETSLPGIINQSIKNIEYSSKKSVFISFKEADGGLTSLNKLRSKSTKQPRARLLEIEHILENNRQRFKSQETVLQHLHKEKIKKCIKDHNTAKQQQEIMSKMTRQAPGFFVKIPARNKNSTVRKLVSRANENKGKRLLTEDPFEEVRQADRGHSHCQSAQDERDQAEHPRDGHAEHREQEALHIRRSLSPHTPERQAARPQAEELARLRSGRTESRTPVLPVGALREPLQQEALRLRRRGTRPGLEAQLRVQRVAVCSPHLASTTSARTSGRSK